MPFFIKKAEILKVETGQIRDVTDEVGVDFEYVCWPPYIWEEGNFSCDCNMELFFERADGREPNGEGLACGDDRFEVCLTSRDGQVWASGGVFEEDGGRRRRMSESEDERKWRHIAQDADTKLLEIKLIVPNLEGLGELIEAVKEYTAPAPLVGERDMMPSMKRTREALRACGIEMEGEG